MRFKELIRVEVYDEDGNVVDYRQSGECDGHGTIDLVTDAGLADVARMVAERFNYVSVGTGVTATVHDDTTMEAECMDRVVAATSLSSTFYTNDTAEFRGTFTPASNYSIGESGIHLASTGVGDIMYARETFPVMAIIAGRSFQITWQIIMMR